MQIDDYPITDKFLAEIKNKIQKEYSSNNDFLDIKAEPNNSLKIIGHKHNEIRIEVSQIIEKAKTYNFPDFWEDTVEFLKSDDLVMVKNLGQGTNEWNRLEANLKLTMPQA